MSLTWTDSDTAAATDAAPDDGFGSDNDAPVDDAVEAGIAGARSSKAADTDTVTGFRGGDGGGA